ncbi:MAG: hypothetical protein Q9227_004325 [Pyrenula ochraceoflavens]
MSVSSPLASRCCRRALRSYGQNSSIPRAISSRCLRYASTQSLSSPRHHKSISRQRRYQSTNASPASPINPKISAIVDQISQLTLLETADLVSSLKSRLNIPDLPVGGFAAPPPGAPGAAAAAPAVEEEEEAPKPAAKTTFTLKLQKFEAAAKPKIIKEIKSMLGLSLVDSKKFVESAPKVMREGVPKEEAEKIVKTVKDLGGEVSMD